MGSHDPNQRGFIIKIMFCMVFVGIKGHLGQLGRSGIEPSANWP